MWAPVVCIPYNVRQNSPPPAQSISHCNSGDLKCLSGRVFTPGPFPPIATQRRNALSGCAVVLIRQGLTNGDTQTAMRSPKVTCKILTCGTLRWENRTRKRFSLSVSKLTVSCFCPCCHSNNMCTFYLRMWQKCSGDMYEVLSVLT